MTSILAGLRPRDKIEKRTVISDRRRSLTTAVVGKISKSEYFISITATNLLQHFGCLLRWSKTGLRLRFESENIIEPI